ncbi:uncharacterized protein LOC141854220 [Brevipalpus obovatus]|uniref:uncharacterized protein LOC141854220 n=1 Tax=Brevipalpus obovatus TaxID=246614 RepID=UPI003D9EE86A
MLFSIVWNVFLLSILIPIAVSVKVDFQKCGGDVKEVRISGCIEDNIPCIVSRENKAKLEFDFKAPFDSDYVYIDVTSTKSDSMWTRFMPLLGTFERNACNNHGIACPIKNNKLYTYNYSMYLDRNLPVHKGEYQIKLTSFWGYPIACFTIPIELK